MQGNARQQQIGQRLMQGFQPFRAEKAFASHHKPTDAKCQQQQPQKQHHQCAQWIMAEVAWGLACAQCLQIAAQALWRREPVTEAGMAAANEAPHGAQDNQDTDAVTGPAMQATAFFKQREIGQYQ